MEINIILMLITLLSFVILGFMMYRAIQKLDAQPKKGRNGKKGKNRYMPQVKNPGK